MSEKTKFLEEIIEEAYRRHHDDLEKFLWYICEASNMPRNRARFICNVITQNNPPINK